MNPFMNIFVLILPNKLFEIYFCKRNTISFTLNDVSSVGIDVCWREQEADALLQEDHKDWQSRFEQIWTNGLINQ